MFSKFDLDVCPPDEKGGGGDPWDLGLSQPWQDKLYTTNKFVFTVFINLDLNLSLSRVVFH